MRGRKKTDLEHVKEISLYNLENGDKERLLISLCIAFGVITPDEAKETRFMDGLGLKDFLKPKRDARIKELEQIK